MRSAVVADIARLAEVHVASWRETYCDIVDTDVFRTFDVAERMEAWTRVLGPQRHVDSVVVVAEVDGSIVGFASSGPPRLRTPARDWELASLYTLARVHGCGVGSALLEAAVGDRPAEVWLATGNERAAAFYRKHGFTEDGVTGVFDRWRIPEMRMVR